MRPVTRKILLNPGPGTTTDTVKKSLVVEDICPREKDFGDLIDGINKDLVKIVQGEDDYVSTLFASSGTGGLEAAVTSAIPAGGKLLVVENGAYGTRIARIATTFGIEVVPYSLSYGDYPDVVEIEKVIGRNAGITHLAMVHHETTTGMLNPVDEITSLAHRHKIQIILDCMSSYAGIPIDLRHLPVEYLVASSNKCIQGMAGLVFVIFQKRLLDQIKDSNRSFYFDLFNQYSGFKESGQMQFTPPVQVAYALRQAIDEYFLETGEGRWKRYKENWQLLFKGLKELGFKFLLPDAQQSKILLAVIEPDHPSYNFDAMHDFVQKQGFTIYPGKDAKEKTFRLSILGDLYQEDIQNFLICLREYMEETEIEL